MNIDCIYTDKSVSALARILRMYPEATNYISSLLLCNDMQLEELEDLASAKKISPDLINYVSQTEDSVRINRIVRLLKHGFPFGKEVVEFSKDLGKSEIICEAKAFACISEIFEIFKPDMTEKQLSEILKGMQQGLHRNRILFYANPKFDGQQMMEIRKAFKNGVPDEEVMIIASTMFSGEMMRQMRKGFQNGLNSIEVFIYAQSFFDVLQASNIRQVIEEGFSSSKICFIANPDFSAEQMFYIRVGYESGLSIKEVESYIYLPEKELRRRLKRFQMREIKKFLN